ncbi:Asp-tRNA(Asn)/Glu-tRNA(Gln) amidotransferase subunit GatC [Candidatus Dependentiae bacterium]|nr:Asp-tRNA(Asn)/Glu-tRNA(Gln) amidotransferase subunit GatC [Candidatus Dependentiae bacterium]
MVKITKEEVLKLAHMSQVAIDEHDIEKLTAKLDAVLSYASCLIEVAQGKKVYTTVQSTNVVREDRMVKTDPELLLSLAPEREEDYYVVPMILKNS